MNIDKLLCALTIAFICGYSSAALAEPPEKPSSQATAGDHSETKSSGHETPRWGYSGKIGPEHWADLSPDWAIARNGKRQSPIDISRPIEKKPTSVEFNYQPTRVNIINNGHSIQVNCDKGSSITVDGKAFQLEQFHFHAPSEHTVEGKSFDMELHLVHKSAEGELAVVGVLINSGKANKAYRRVWKHLPNKPGEEQHFQDRVNAVELLPVARAYYTYSGSLTTPPCSEGVKWLLLSTPVELSARQVAAFNDIYSGNNRPVQPLYGRKVTKSE